MAAGLRVTDATLDVLEALLRGGDELYGLKIAREVGRPTGSVFPILARLERLGLVVSEWESGEARGPRRRFYRLSPDGLVEARRLVAERRRPVRGGSVRRLVPGTEV